MNSFLWAGRITYRAGTVIAGFAVNDRSGSVASRHCPPDRGPPFIAMIEYHNLRRIASKIFNFCCKICALSAGQEKSAVKNRAFFQSIYEKIPPMSRAHGQNFLRTGLWP